MANNNNKFIQQTHSLSTMTIMVLVVVVMFITLVISRVAIPLLASSCNMMVSLINQRPFIHIILNFIIISLFASSSFSLVFKFQLIRRHNNHTSLQRTTSHVIPFFGDDDTWWVGIVDDNAHDHHQLAMMPSQTVSSSASTWHATEEEEEEEDDVAAERREEAAVVEEKEEDDTLDDTWKAIMEAKTKGGGPHLKKSGTWSHGDLGGGGGGGLKRWRTLRDGGGGGGGGGGWKEVLGLTYHDEFKNKADAFINQFVNNMRLQRLKSDQRFLEMINRGR